MKLLKKYGDKDSFESILYLLLNSIKIKADEYQKDSSYNNLTLLQNYLTFFMILTLNLKNYPEYIKTIFIGKLNFFHILVEILIQLKKNKILLRIINNLFLDEYKEIFFNPKKPNPELEQLFINEQILFCTKYSGSNFHYEKETYIKIFSKLLNFDLSYDNFFSYHKDKIEIEEKPIYKLSIAQSIIRVVFSKEKNKYTKEKFYEFNLLKRVIDKDIEETIEKYGDQYKTLFRKEDICDDFLKYMFFVFGNTMIIESFINPLKKIMEGIGPNDRDINKDEFNSLIIEFISKIKKTIPDVLKVLLKLLYESVKSHFTIEKDNYGPLYTTLIFNFIISPRVQMIYNIGSQNTNFIRSLNRLFRNTCFNFKFSEEDQLYNYNDVVEKNHFKIKNFIKENIIGINIGESKAKISLGDIFTEKYLLYPHFLFYWDSNILSQSIQGGVNEFIEYENLEAKKDS